MDRISYPFRYSNIPDVGYLFVPTIPIKLKTIVGLAKFNFIVDTGADMTTLPHFMASKLGINLKAIKQSQVEGIGGVVIKTWITRVDLYLNEQAKITVRASITDEDSTPLLLGRTDLLDKVFSWNFDAKSKLIKFDPL